LEKDDFTEPVFFDGICRTLEKEAPYRLRHAAVAFLRHLDGQFFDPNKTFSEDSEQAAALMFRWSVSARGDTSQQNDGIFSESSAVWAAASLVRCIDASRTPR